MEERKWRRGGGRVEGSGGEDGVGEREVEERREGGEGGEERGRRW